MIQRFEVIRRLIITFVTMVLRFLILSLILIPQFSSGQKLVDEIKKKYFGAYQGTIAAYKLDTGAELVAVEETTIFIVLTEDNIILEIGNNKTSGTYSVLFEGDDYYVLNAIIEGQIQSERIVVHQKGKTVTREGIHPQPNAVLDKLSRKELKNRE